MADGRNANQNNRQFEIDPNTRMDLVFRCESPRVQQMILHQNLREEIERSSANKVKYVDSELYFKHQQRSLGNSSEIQSTTLNIGNTNFPSSQVIRKANVGGKTAAASASTLASSKDLTESSGRLDSTSFNLNDYTSEQNNSSPSTTKSNPNCQVCRIKEVRHSLMNINKVVQERNEQIAKLKAKCLRSYFEKQVLD